MTTKVENAWSYGNGIPYHSGGGTGNDGGNGHDDDGDDGHDDDLADTVAGHRHMVARRIKTRHGDSAVTARRDTPTLVRRPGADDG